MEKQNNLKDLANQLLFDLTELELKQIDDDFNVFIAQVDFLKNINTDKVEEMVYPFENNTTFLREDCVDHILSQQDALSNAKVVDNGYVKVPKVVK